MGTTNFDTIDANIVDGTTSVSSEPVGLTVVSRTATSDGTGTGTIADGGIRQFVTVAATAATQIVVLPTPTPGTLVMISGPASTGFELRSSAPSTVGINGGTGASAESAIAANSTVWMLCTSATNWDGFEIIAGTTFGAVEAAA